MTMLLTPRFLEALKLVFELDANNPRKGTEVPYLAHLLSVCALVLYDGGDENEATAALLHDTLEDHSESVTAELLATRFGQRVYDLVRACSDTPEGYAGGPKPEWRQRKERYLSHLQSAEPSLLRISAADKLDNARAILADYRKVGEELWKRFNAGRDDQLWYYWRLVEAYRAAGFRSSIADELEQVVGELEREAGKRR